MNFWNFFVKYFHEISWSVRDRGLKFLPVIHYDMENTTIISNTVHVIKKYNQNFLVHLSSPYILGYLRPRRSPDQLDRICWIFFLKDYWLSTSWAFTQNFGPLKFDRKSTITKYHCWNILPKTYHITSTCCKCNETSWVCRTC